MSLLAQLNSTLAVQLATVSQADGDELETETKRSRVICDIAKQIIDSHQIVLDATKLQIMAGGAVTIDDDLLAIGHKGIEE